jgi:hypothetical protein
MWAKTAMRKELARFGRGAYFAFYFSLTSSLNHRAHYLITIHNTSISPSIESCSNLDLESYCAILVVPLNCDCVSDSARSERVFAGDSLSPRISCLRAIRRHGF